MNWQPAEQTATNPQTGQKIALVGGQWVPFSQSATNPETGARLVLVEGEQVSNSLGRQVRLTTRAGIEGLGQLVEPLTEPLRVAGNVALRAVGAPMMRQSAGQLARSAADTLGLPSPQTADERVAMDTARLMASSAGLFTGARALAGGAQGVTRNVLETLASRPGAQLASAAGAAGLGGSVREAGGGPVEQAVAALAGGVAAPFALSAAGNAAQNVRDRVRNVIDSLRPNGQQIIDNRVQSIIAQSGVDLPSLSAGARAQLMRDVEEAMKLPGQLDPAAISRLSAFRNVGATPTRGPITQRPVDITREKNLSRLGANTTNERLQALANLENTNAQRLIDALNDAGARNAPDNFAAGSDLNRRLDDLVKGAERKVDLLYSRARDAGGRSAPLEAQTFVRQAREGLERKMAVRALPADIDDRLRSIERGEPLTVASAEELKTALSRIQRTSNDGNARFAAGVVRNALENTPLESRAPGVGQQTVDAFNTARRANRQLETFIENNPAFLAVREGAEPDKFVDQFVMRAPVNQLDTLVKALRATAPRGVDPLVAVRQNLVSRLQDAATSGGETVRFNAASYRKALDNIGDRRLALLFSPQEVRLLRDVGRVSELMSAQPAGSAVNNSNSATVAMGMGSELMRALPGVARALPGANLVQQITAVPATNTALNVPGALRQIPQRVPLEDRSLPAALAALLASQSINQQQNNQRP